MTQRQHTKKWRSRTLSLLMAVLMTAQLSISVYAEMGVQPVQEETAAAQVLTEATEEPQISTEETEATLATDPALNDEQENILPDVSEETQAATESEVPTVSEETQAVTEPASSDISEETQAPEPELFAQSSEYEYVEVTSVDQITSGATYAITYTANNGCCILYHKNAEKRSDQVSGTIADRKLTLCDFKNYPETTQTWTISAVEGDGYTVKSCSGTNMYLNLNEITTEGVRVPVSNNAQTVKITAVDGGFHITGTADGNPSYLSHGATGQFFVGAAACTVKLFKQTPKENPSKPTDPLAIPGFTRVTDGKLEETKYYMIVSKDSKDNLYAFYPDAAYKTADPGNTIVPGHAKGCPKGTFVANLTVDTANNTVTAKRATEKQTELTMKDLCFTLQKNNAQWAFLGQNGLYLSLGKEMLSEDIQYFTVAEKSSGVFKINNGYRHLDFNKRDDPKEFKKGMTTNFWGPGDNRFPIYLYTMDNETVEPTVNKASLNSAIKKADEFETANFDQQSVDALNAAKNAAVAERNSTASTIQTVKEATDTLVKAMQAMKPKAELMAPDRPNPATGVTTGEPFPAGTGGSDTFRIPALITLKDGSLAAAIDARWDYCPDGFSIDTLFSRSTDGGKTWHYNFPNYFNDSVDQYWGGDVKPVYSDKGYAASFIDPVMVQGNDGTIYLMVDLFPGGTYIGNALTDSGYEEVDGVERLAIHYSHDGRPGTYDFYVGDFSKADGEQKAFAPLIAKDDKTKTAAYYVDDHYNLYTSDKQPMYCKQLGTSKQPWSGKYVQQNVFYYNAEVHVRRATFLWLVTSNDNGQTWSAPTIMNPMVRKSPATHKFYGVGPGAGLCLDDGTVMLTCYLHSPEYSSFIYKNPGDNTWHRSENATSDNSSESTLVQIDENTVRQFCRDGVKVVRYTDHKRDPATMEWKAQAPVRVEGVAKTTWNQVSALRYSKEVNGKPVILLSTASTGSNSRENGKIYAFNLENDKGRTMTLIGTYEVNKLGQVYGYSSLTELSDGSIGLLYEDTWTHASYRNIEISEIIPSAIVDGKRSVKVSLYQSEEDKFEFKTLPTEEELAQMDSTIATGKLVDGKVVYTGNKVGQTSYVTGGVTIIVKVTEPENIQEVPLEFGQTKDLTVESDKIQWNTNPDIVDAKITTIDKSVTVTGGQCHTGTNASYNENTEPLAKALHIFEADGDGFQAWTKDASGVKVWLNPGGQLGFPVSGHSVTTYFDQQDDGTFFVRTKDRYLAFWRDGKNVFDAGSNTAGVMDPLCRFKLYRPAENGEKSSADLPGYVQVTKRDQIHDGGLYLIAAESQNEIYILWPTSDSSSKYAHVAKADKTAQNVTHQVENKIHTLSLTGKAIGTSDVVVDDVIYRVTVTHDHVFGEDWTHDETNHWHQCECGEKTDVEAHSFGDWTVTKEPTATETGTKVHTCGVCGYEQTEQIPATGETTVDYKVIEGADGSFTKGTETTLTFRTNGDFSKFAGIKVDGVLVDASDYTADAEKSAVTLGAAYLDTLSVGTHKVTVLFEDGECSADFAVKEASVPAEPTKPGEPTKPSNPTTPGKPVKPNGNKPNTGDNSNAVLWGTLLLVSAAAIAGTVYSFKKKKHNG